MSTFFTTLRLKLYDCWLSCLEAALPADRPSPLFGLFNTIFNGILLVWGCALVFSENCSVSSFRWVILGIIHAGINMFFAAAVMAVTRYKISKGIPIMTSTFHIFVLEPVILIYIAYLIWEITWIVMATQIAIFTTKDSCGHHIYVQVALLVAYLLTGAVVFGCTFMSTWGAMPEWRERANTCWNFNNRMARMANPSTSSRSTARVREVGMESRRRPMTSTMESFMDGGPRLYQYNSHNTNKDKNNNNNNNLIGNSIFHTVSNHTISSGDVDNSSLHNHSINNNVNINNIHNNTNIVKDENNSKADLDLLMEKDRLKLCQELHVSNYRNIPENRNCEFDKYLTTYHYNDNYCQHYNEPQLHEQHQHNENVQSTWDKFDTPNNVVNVDDNNNNNRYNNHCNDDKKTKFYSIANNNTNMCNFPYDKEYHDDQEEQQQEIEEKKKVVENEEYNEQKRANDVNELEHDRTKNKEVDSIVNGIQEENAKEECIEDKAEEITENHMVNKSNNNNCSNNNNNNLKTDINIEQITEQQPLSSSSLPQEEWQQSLPQDKKYMDSNANVEECTSYIAQVDKY